LKRILAGFLLDLSGCARRADPQPSLPFSRLDLLGLNRIDLSDPVQSRLAWDTSHVTASIQGIINRNGANFFIRHMPAGSFLKRFETDNIRHKQP